MLAIRPPRDLPPTATRGPPPKRSTIPVQRSRRTGSRSGAPRLPSARRFAMYGNSKRTTRMPRVASPSATRFLKPESMGPPAPCAKRNTASVDSGPSRRTSLSGPMDLPVGGWRRRPDLTPPAAAERQADREERHRADRRADRLSSDEAAGGVAHDLGQVDHRGGLVPLREKSRLVVPGQHRRHDERR